ncbi:YkoF family thiamine/hydroxymethylpyrimidine-binding protein [Thorsellia anophelis]|uniref:YKOF-related Family n=1 Tax=Thorsellia anophelis DSM 18579 TaxID=1123402 RepID=A0A1H9Y6G0_9GAMM|nr:YkoF family thiamine/hydroxymethylpyrimidine-binding protein [Thorsellia anophelis]SES64371.1 YKOF-related Family [Thorsellia anophelis DSM 18579]
MTQHFIDIKSTQSITHNNFGIGARFTVNVMSDDYISIILSALENTPKKDVDVITDPVSTYVTGNEQAICEYICSVIHKIASSHHHVSVSLMLSRGCPGEVTCQLPDDTLFTSNQSITLAPTGINVLAQWSLYPLIDTIKDNYSHMTDIYSAIEYTKQKKIYKRSHHYVTELQGDLSAIIETIASGWLMVGRTVQHVTTHATISINSPSKN